MIEKWIRYASLHPLRILAAAAAFLALVLLLSALLGGDNDKREAQTQQAPATQVPANDSSQQLPSIEDAAYQEYLKKEKAGKAEEFEGSPQFLAKLRQQTASMAPLYDMAAYKGKSIRLQYLRRSSDGRFVVEITCLSSFAVAEQEWKEYLKYYKDDGSKYLTLYKRPNGRSC